MSIERKGGMAPAPREVEQQKDNTKPIGLKAARWYAEEAGLAVFPIAPRSKVPLTANGFKNASKNSALLHSWWDRWPEAGVGIATGTVSQLVVLDMDHRPDKSASEVLEALEDEFGRLPDTPHVLTGGYGYQFCFRSTEVIRSRTGFRPGLDVKAEGGYVVAPPSIHPNGRRYEWEAYHRPPGVPFAPLPQNIRDALIDHAKPSPPAQPPDVWRGLFLQGVREGERNNAVAKLAGYLLRRGIDRFLAIEIVRLWNRERVSPPLDDRELQTTVESIARAELARRNGVKP